MASTSEAFVKKWQGLLLIALTVSATSGADNNETAAPAQDCFCPLYQYVYPYWSLCNRPLRHFQAFHLLSGAQGGLEIGAAGLSNVVSFTGRREMVGETYYAVPLGRDPLLGVPVSTEVELVNSKTREPLTWTFHAQFRGLVLTEGFSRGISECAAVFRFLRMDGHKLPCPFIVGARCEAYYLVSDGAPHGLTPFKLTEAGPTVIMPALEGSELKSLLSFLVILPQI